ncbi:hypothetical protein F3I27_08750 [Pantoea sp. Bo_2]|uniref:Uncharacterized protein n=1 Tax=Candidatus Pantoea gossypiicola TaxID=2608008 RepID=A0AB34CQC5_9GAMM|nr:hypothetical protein F3I59_05960 [Pantoea sp. VH_8]KAA5936749.1 hypothetical protein F3I58_05990 [Pantoea sp. VH_4]KAA5948308.1 hypothetical protein F3I57_06510 [Pantoea sp. VH_3]KAA5953578.1 hypothetical protein F3I56_08380 [Pantoea sp. VH_25]KAA5956586.1 hypothetical protein F3I55_10770 [Pantoea sp. VH_24]KAA5960431.1 hypothetical protein F3I53_10935 [Pantoea sp. VH_16]KAA5965003.1 hypothetical protein F3I54_11505 [Pantoea sp. VH_18]KAA5985434.1 hypothetical protein F3I48_01510 [Pantoea
MIAAGTIVRRRKRRKTMIVLECTNSVVLCGWVDKGRFYKRRFPLSELKICVPYSNFWSLT